MYFRPFTRLQSLRWSTANSVSRAMNIKHPTERHLALLLSCPPYLSLTCSFTFSPIPSSAGHTADKLQISLPLLHADMAWTGSYSNVSVVVPEGKRFASGRGIKFNVFSINSGQPWYPKLREAPRLCQFVWKSQ